MKLNKEKMKVILIGIVLILIFICLIIFLINNGNKNKFKEYYEDVEKNVVENSKYLKAQYINDYLGKDLIFKEKKIETKKLSNYEILSYITNYFFTNEIKDDISNEVLTKLEETLKNKDAYIIYSGKTIRDYAKKLLNIDWENQNATSKENQIYNFEYIKNEDIYIITPSEYYENYENKLDDESKDVEINVINSRSTNKSIETTILVAYTEQVKNDNEIIIKYYKDSEQKNLIFEINASELYILDENNELIKNPNVDTVLNHKKEFNQYIVTSTKNGDDFPITSIKRK